MNTTDREKLRAKLRALRAKTVDNGCTEAEAMAAAEKAAALMKEFSVDAADLDMSEASVSRGTVRSTPRELLYATIAFVTNTSSVVIQGWDKNSTVFVGTEPGPDIATYLYKICDRALDREIAIFKASDFYKRRRKLATKRHAVADFTYGMVLRLSRKLRELFQGSLNSDQRDAAKSALAHRYSGVVSKPIQQRDARYSHAANEGWIAGNNVNLHHGVGGAGEVLKIGGAS